MGRKHDQHTDEQTNMAPSGGWVKTYWTKHGAFSRVGRKGDGRTEEHKEKKGTDVDT